MPSQLIFGETIDETHKGSSKRTSRRKRRSWVRCNLQAHRKHETKTERTRMLTSSAALFTTGSGAGSR
jgi:hypothetical protein